MSYVSTIDRLLSHRIFYTLLQRYRGIPHLLNNFSF
jgi:hypothetical protein